MSALSNSPYSPDLHGFVEFLEAEHPEHVIRIAKEVDPKFGVTGILARLEKDGRFPLVIFENIKGSTIPLVANMHADFERLRLGLGMDTGGVREFLVECAAREANPIAPEIVETGPVHEIVQIGDEVDVEELPICTYHEKDAGKYITAGLGVMRDPETGVNNVGIYRHMVHERNLLGVQLSETADGNVILKKYEKAGRACPIAIVIGHHPAFFLGSLSFTLLDTDELHIAGGMLQRPVQLVRCKTIPLEVPADAEIVIECEIPPELRRAEAPFGEFPGTYGPERMNPVLEIKAITRRKDPLYQNAFVGHSDNLMLSGLVRSTFIEETVKIACPTVTGVNVPRSGRHRFVCYIAIERMIEGEAKQAAMAAFVAFIVAWGYLLAGFIAFIAARGYTTPFPEVRLKRYMETRGADGGPWRRLCALPALWTGLLYDQGALDAAWDLVKDWTDEEREMLRAEAPRRALKTPFRDGTLGDLALEVLRISRAGLKARAMSDEFGDDECHFLNILDEIAESRRTPAEVKLEAYRERWGESVDPLYREFMY